MPRIVLPESVDDFFYFYGDFPEWAEFSVKFLEGMKALFRRKSARRRMRGLPEKNFRVVLALLWLQKVYQSFNVKRNRGKPRAIKKRPRPFSRLHLPRQVARAKIMKRAMR